jgi:hypothetical protein
MNRLWLELAGIIVVVVVPLLAVGSVAPLVAGDHGLTPWVFFLLFFAGISPAICLGLLLAIDRIRRVRSTKKP